MAIFCYENVISIGNCGLYYNKLYLNFENYEGTIILSILHLLKEENKGLSVSICSGRTDKLHQTKDNNKLYLILVILKIMRGP